jgi:hypothetical protein
LGHEVSRDRVLARKSATQIIKVSYLRGRATKRENPMSFEITVMKFVERVLMWGRKKEAKKHPEDVEKLAKLDEAIAEVHQDRVVALDKHIADMQAERAEG